MYLELRSGSPASPASVLLRQKILKKCRDDIYHFLNHENGQIAIYDAVNPLAAGRRSLAKEFAKHDVEVLMIGLSASDIRVHIWLTGSRRFSLNPPARTNESLRKTSGALRFLLQT